MNLDGAACQQARKHAGYATLDEARTAIRAFPKGRGTTVHWLSMLERGRWDNVPEPVAVAIAAAYGVGLTELLAPGTEPALIAAALGDDLARIRAHLDAVAARWGILSSPRVAHPGRFGG